jgi:predicted RNase H-like HicB family nuclease
MTGPSTSGELFALWEANCAACRNANFASASARTLVPMRFTAAVTHEGSWQVARCLEVEVASQGETVEEALANLREALELYFEDEMLPESIEPPIIATIELSA